MRLTPRIVLCVSVGVCLLAFQVAESPAGAKRIEVLVFFARNPASSADQTVVVPVVRTTPRADLATFAIEQLIAGPTQRESAGGLFTPVRLTGRSDCADRNFRLSIAQRRRIATLQFCRHVSSSGVGDDILIRTSIEKTLRQFPTVGLVIVLTEKNHCFGDVSGADTCKRH